MQDVLCLLCEDDDDGVKKRYQREWAEEWKKFLLEAVPSYCNEQKEASSDAGN